jgi:hypothetical protein
MRPPAILAVLSFAAALSAAPIAHADATTTETLSPGGSMRSSADAVPSPAMPVIVTLTAGLGCNSFPCQDTATYTVTLKDRHDPDFFPDVPLPPVWTGPQIDVSASSIDTAGAPSVAIDVDRSLATPGWIHNPQERTQQFTVVSKPCSKTSGDIMLVADLEELPDGDVRLLPAVDGRQCEESQYAVSQYPFAVDLPGPVRRPLADALRRGLTFANDPLGMSMIGGGYRNTYKVTASVKQAVAKKLGLKSTVVGSLSGVVDELSDAWRPVPLTAPAKKAFKRAKTVDVALKVVARGLGGQSAPDTGTIVLR